MVPTGATAPSRSPWPSAWKGPSDLPSLCALLAFIALAAQARRADADAEPASSVRLVWVRGERTQGCDDRATIVRRVVERLGRNVFSESASRSIEGVIQHEGERWEAHLYVRDADGSLFGSRHLTSAGADCTALSAAVTLAIALVIDPDAALRPVPSAPPSAAPPSPPAPVPPSAPSAEPVRPSPSTRPSPMTSPPPPPGRPPPPLYAPKAAPKAEEPSPTHSVAVTERALVAAGLLPGAAAGAALSAEGPTGLALHGSAGLMYLPEVRAGDFAFGLTAGWLGACVQPWVKGRLALAVCGKVLLGAIHSVVYALEPYQPGDRVWSSASLSLGARLRVAGPLVAEVGAEGLVSFTPWQFVVAGPGTVPFRQAPVAGFAFAGLGVSIP